LAQAVLEPESVSLHRPSVTHQGVRSASAAVEVHLAGCIASLHRFGYRSTTH